MIHEITYIDGFYKEISGNNSNLLLLTTNDNFQHGDVVLIKEWNDDTNNPTGRETLAIVDTMDELEGYKIVKIKNMVKLPYGWREGVKTMKERKLYECEICHTNYSDKEECKKCEASHKVDLKIVGMRFTAYKDNRAGFPTSIEVVAHNGERVIYKR